MKKVTIEINLSDLVDVINNSKNPQVCKQLLAGGDVRDLDKRYTDEGDYYKHRIIWEKKDGKKTDTFVMLKAIGHNIWEDTIIARVFERSGEMYYRTEYSWSAWCSLEEVQGDEFALADENPYEANWGDVETDNH